MVLMQNKAKVVATRFLVRLAGRLHRTERRYRRFLINVNPLKLVYMKLRVYLLTFLLDNTHTNKRTHISEDLKC